MVDLSNNVMASQIVIDYSQNSNMNYEVVVIFINYNTVQKFEVSTIV